jgi:diadenylate cyclase
MFTYLKQFVETYLKWPDIGVIDVVEILIISVIVYELLRFIQSTKAWMVFKGLIIILLFTLIAVIFNMNTILWLLNKSFNVGVIALLIMFQPELRKVLEQLGQKNVLVDFFKEGRRDVTERFSDDTLNEVIKATFELAKTKTGALIVMEQDVKLTEFEMTGISMDAKVSNQLLINIFEHNTPLHDGAIIIRGDRIVAATCYLHLSENMMLSKELGTRHRAGLGISEESDSLTIIVSEETGKVSVAYGGILERNIDGDRLREKLVEVQDKKVETKRIKLRKGRNRNEAEDTE